MTAHDHWPAWVTVPRTACRWLLGLGFMAISIGHFVQPARGEFERMVPPLLPAPDVIVVATGVMELAGGLGLLIPRTRRITGFLLMLFLVAVFPANVWGALQQETFLGARQPNLWLRTPFQVLLIALVYWVSQPLPAWLRAGRPDQPPPG